MKELSRQKLSESPFASYDMLVVACWNSGKKTLSMSSRKRPIKKMHIWPKKPDPKFVCELKEDMGQCAGEREGGGRQRMFYL